jgi:lysophospholipase L1-like esterase
LGKTSTSFGYFTTLTLMALLRSSNNPATDVVFLQAGTNDICGGRNPQAAPENMRRLLVAVREQFPRALILVGPIPPLKATTGRADYVQPFNRATEAAVLQMRDKRLLFTGQWKANAFANVPYSKDGVHPLKDGLEVIAQAWVRALKRSRAVP